MPDRTNDIERLINLNSQYVDKLRQMLLAYDNRRSKAVNLLVQMMVFTTISTLLLISSYTDFPTDTVDLFVVRTYVLIQAVLVIAFVGFAFKFAIDYSKIKVGSLQQKNDIRIVANLLYQASKRASQLKEHTLGNDNYATYRLEIDLKLIEAEDLFARAVKIKGIGDSIFERIGTSEVTETGILRKRESSVSSAAS